MLLLDVSVWVVWAANALELPYDNPVNLVDNGMTQRIRLLLPIGEAIKLAKKKGAIKFCLKIQIL